jgi:hypothetical protein
LPMVPASSGLLRPLNVHHYAAGKRQCPSLAQDQRLDQETVLVDEVRRSQSAGEPSAAHTIMSGPASALT